MLSDKAKAYAYFDLAFYNKSKKKEGDEDLV